MMLVLLCLFVFIQNPIGGYLRYETFSRIDSVRYLYKVATTLQINVSLESNRARAFASTNIIYDKLKDSLTVRPIELYITLSRGPIDITAGKKILIWGTGIFVSPSDFVNPWDFRVIYSDLEEFRIGIESILFSAFSNNSFLTAGFIPIFQSNQYPFPSFTEIVPMGSDTFMVRFLGNQRLLPWRKFSNTEVFLLSGTTIGPLDIRVYVFNGFDRDPDLKISWRSMDTVDIYLTYTPIKVYGTFGSSVLGSWEIHYDIAYFKTWGTKSKNLMVKYPYFYGCIGFTRNLLDDNIRLGFDYLVKKVKPSGVFGSPMERFLNEFLKTISFQEYEVSSYSALRLSVIPEKSSLDVTLSGIYDFRSGEPFTMLMISYDWADAVNLRCGVFLSGKKGKSPFTQIGKHLDQLGYFEVRYSF